MFTHEHGTIAHIRRWYTSPRAVPSSDMNELQRQYQDAYNHIQILLNAIELQKSALQRLRKGEELTLGNPPPMEWFCKVHGHYPCQACNPGTVYGSAPLTKKGS